jgi:hypothetical protein
MIDNMTKVEYMTTKETVDCPCTQFEQDDTSPFGLPSLICGVCKGTGVTTTETVYNLAVEMLKIVNDAGEIEDPFATWERLEQ